MHGVLVSLPFHKIGRDKGVHFIQRGADRVETIRPKYEKTKDYFRAIGNLHQELTGKREPKGSLMQAAINAKSSLKSKEETERACSYSEMHILMEALGIELS